MRSVVDIVNENGSKRIGVTTGNKFIRNRKMTYSDIIFFILNNNGKTLAIELDHFVKKLGKKTVTKQAFSKQRQYMNPGIFKYLNNEDETKECL